MAAICVFCASSTRIEAAYVALAAQVGTELAGRGHSLVSGGGALSMMGALAEAVREGNGHTVGVIPAALAELEVADAAADELLVVEDMRTRKALMDTRAEAFLALPGGIGTLEELLEVWVARSLGLHTKPVVVLDVDGVFAPLRAQVDLLVARGFVRPAGAAALTWTTTVAQALDAVEAGLHQRVPVVPTVGEVVEAVPDEGSATD